MYLYIIYLYYIFFFFSSRRRHTRYIGDWSSDVCSSDLSVSAACSGARNSRKPAGRSRAGSKSGGAELTATMRFEKGRGTSAGFGLVVAVAIVEVSPFRCEFERKPAGELEAQFEGQPAETRNL